MNLTEIHHATNRRGCTGRNLHKIQLGVTGNLQRLTNRHHADVPTVGSDKANFRDADALIHSKFISADMLLLLVYEQIQPCLRLVF